MADDLPPPLVAADEPICDPIDDEPTHIPRPPNAFILFRASFIRQQKITGKVEANHGTLSKIIGMYWKSLPHTERLEWEEKARVAQAEHRKKYPDWRFKVNSHPNSATFQPSSSKSKGKTKAKLKPRPKAKPRERDKGKAKAREDELHDGGNDLHSGESSPAASDPGSSRSPSKLDDLRMRKIIQLLTEGKAGREIEVEMSKWDALTKGMDQSFAEKTLLSQSIASMSTQPTFSRSSSGGPSQMPSRPIVSQTVGTLQELRQRHPHNHLRTLSVPDAQSVTPGRYDHHSSPPSSTQSPDCLPSAPFYLLTRESTGNGMTLQNHPYVVPPDHGLRHGASVVRHNRGRGSTISASPYPSSEVRHSFPEPPRPGTLEQPSLPLPHAYKRSLSAPPPLQDVRGQQSEDVSSYMGVQESPSPSSTFGDKFITNPYHSLQGSYRTLNQVPMKQLGYSANWQTPSSNTASQYPALSEQSFHREDGVVFETVSPSQFEVPFTPDLSPVSPASPTQSPSRWNNLSPGLETAYSQERAVYGHSQTYPYSYQEMYAQRSSNNFTGHETALDGHGMILSIPQQTNYGNDVWLPRENRHHSYDQAMQPMPSHSPSGLGYLHTQGTDPTWTGSPFAEDVESNVPNTDGSAVLQWSVAPGTAGLIANQSFTIHNASDFRLSDQSENFQTSPTISDPPRTSTYSTLSGWAGDPNQIPFLPSSTPDGNASGPDAQESPVLSSASKDDGWHTHPGYTVQPVGIPAGNIASS